jgi:glycosyltransferase involved in cell wall biosynthesis
VGASVDSASTVRHERSAPPTGVVAVGDFGHERCGVGGSLASLSDSIGGVVVLDTAATGIREFTRQARAAARTGARCAGVYPSRSTVSRADLLVRAMVLRLVFGRDRFRLQLHEYRHLRRKLRWPVTLALLLPGRIVVSSATERDAVAGALRGYVGRHREIVVAPPTNGTAPSAVERVEATRPHPGRERVVGVFGMKRPDKNVDWLVSVLEHLDPRFDRLVLAGGGWDEQDWPPAITDRYDIDVLGHIPRNDLAALFVSWGLAIAPLWDTANDGRMSLRTPLAFGVPTISVGPRGPELTLDPPHLLLVPPVDPATVDVDGIDRRAAAEVVAAFEQATAHRLAAALFA